MLDTRYDDNCNSLLNPIQLINIIVQKKFKHIEYKNMSQHV